MKSAGMLLFEQWCCGSYVWDALTDIEKQRWEWLASNIEKRLLEAHKAGMTEAAKMSISIIKRYHPQGVHRTWEQTEQQILAARDEATI